MDALREISLKLRHGERLHQDIVEEVRFLRLRHKQRALEAARAEAGRTDLSAWGRLVAKGAAAQLARSPTPSSEARGFPESRSYWRPPWNDDEDAPPVLR